MFVQPWDAALDRAGWQQWSAGTDRFGVLAVNNVDPARAPLVVPTHFTFRDDELLVHKPVEHRQRVSDHLDERDHGLDHNAARQQRRRLDALGQWRPKP